MKKIALVLLAFVSILSCSKKEDEIIPETVLETFEISSEQTSVKPLEFIIITSSEVSFTQESYKGTINETEIDLIKTENNNLIFSLPQLDSGDATLKLTINNKVGEINFNVSQNIVQNANSIIENEITTPLNNYQNDIQELISDNTFSFEIKEQLASSKQAIDEYLNKLATLPEEEKMNVAKFFNANPLLTSDYLNLSNKSFNGKSNTKYSSIKKSALKLVIVIATVVTAAEIIAPLVVKGLASLGVFAGASAVGAGIIVTALGAAAIIHAEHSKILNNAFLPFENLLKDNDGNYIEKNSGENKTVKNDYEINNNTNYIFSIVSRDRLLNSSDINNNNSDISELVKKIEILESKWNSFKNGVNTIVSNTTNWFVSWFSSSATTFKIITYELKSLPSQTDTVETNGDSGFITIEDFPSDIEVEYSVASDNSIKLKLKADESTLPRTITGKIKYDDGDFSNEKEFSIVLNVTKQPLKIGYYELTYSWEDNKALLHVENKNSSFGVVYLWSSSDNYWYSPNFGYGFSVGLNQINTLWVHLQSGGCFSESFKIENFNQDANSHNGTYTSARCYYNNEIGSSVNLKYIGEVVTNIK
jgi:polyhydroxyalkanoate synthesis regulator phasin